MEVSIHAWRWWWWWWWCLLGLLACWLAGLHGLLRAACIVCFAWLGWKRKRTTKEEEEEEGSSDGVTVPNANDAKLVVDQSSGIIQW